MMRTWHYGGGEYPFDISEAGCIQRLAEALAPMKTESTEDGAAEHIETHCCIIAEFFDTIFGEGSGERICGSIMSAGAYSEAYLDFIAYIREQTESLIRMRAETEARYFRRRDSFPHEVKI